MLHVNEGGEGRLGEEGWPESSFRWSRWCNSRSTSETGISTECHSSTFPWGFWSSPGPSKSLVDLNGLRATVMTRAAAAASGTKKARSSTSRVVAAWISSVVLSSVLWGFVGARRGRQRRSLAVTRRSCSEGGQGETSNSSLMRVADEP